MQYKPFQKEQKLSRLGLGNMRLPVVDGNDGAIDYGEAKALVDLCMKNGVNYYDTAYTYHGGNSEEFVGKALAEYPRESYYVADKFNLQANPDYRAQFAQQLERLQMDRIDFYLLHGLQDRMIDTVLENGCIPYFDEMKKQGKIRYFGFSYHGTAAALPRLLEAYPWDFVQIQLNYYDWFFGDAKELYEILEKANIPIMVMEPVHGGLLANLTPEAAAVLKEVAPEQSLASWAMRWIQDLPAVQVVLSGMSNRAQVEDNTAVFDAAAPLTAQEQECLARAAHLQRAAVAVACTACRYCCADCPAGLDIPMLLKVYNRAKVGGAWRISQLDGVPQDKQPSACIGCGSCTAHCPQNFDVPKYMQEMNEMRASFGK